MLFILYLHVINGKNGVKVEVLKLPLRLAGLMRPIRTEEN